MGSTDADSINATSSIESNGVLISRDPTSAYESTTFKSSMTIRVDQPVGSMLVASACILPKVHGTTSRAACF